MAKIAYKGLADVRVLTAADVKVDGFETIEFRRNQPTEVPDEVAEMLLTRPKTFGRFIRSSDQAETAAADTSTEPPSPDSTPQLGVDSPAGDTAAGTVSGGSTRRSKA